MLNLVNGQVKKLNWGNVSKLAKKEITYHNALASLEDAHKIKLVDKEGKVTYVTAEKILVSVGGRPNYLNLENARELCISSDDIFWMKNDPGKTLVIGSGYIGLECGGFLNGLGKEVTVLYRSKVLRTFDQDIASKIQSLMQDKGIKFLQGTTTSLIKKDNQILVKISMKDKDGNSKDHEELFDTVLLAIGRTPDTKSIGLDKLGVELDKKKKIVVNKCWQSNIDNIYAIGDVANSGYELTPLAIKEGIYLAEGLFNNKWQEIDYNTIPTTVFTPVEYSCCGLSEQKSIEKYGDENIDVYHVNFQPLEW